MYFISKLVTFSFPFIYWKKKLCVTIFLNVYSKKNKKTYEDVQVDRAKFIQKLAKLSEKLCYV